MEDKMAQTHGPMKDDVLINIYITRFYTREWLKYIKLLNW